MPTLALPALAGIVAALMALLILYGAAQLVRAIGHMIPADLPLLGGFLRNAIINIGEAGVRVIGHWLSNLTSPAAKLIGWPIHVAMVLYHHITGTMASLAAATEHVVVHTIPHAIGKLHDTVWRHVAAVEAYLHGLIHHARVIAAHGIAGAIALAHQLVHAAVHNLSADISRVRTYAHGLVHNLRNDMDGAVKHAEHLAAAATAALAARLGDRIDQVAKSVTHELGNAERYTDNAVKTLAGTVATTATKAAEAAITDVGHDVTTAVDATWGTITDEVKALQGVLATDLPGIRALVDAIPTVKPDTIAEAVAGVEAIAVPALRFMRQCGVPNCRNLSQYGRDLQALLGFAGDAALIALLAALATDPEGAAHEVQTVLGPLADGVRAGARDLLGV